VIGIDRDGDLEVHYATGMKMFLNPKLVSPSTATAYEQWKSEQPVALATISADLLELLQRRARHQLRPIDLTVGEVIDIRGMYI
jgi:hypothetical protein